MIFSDCLHHEFKEDMLIGRFQSIIVVPVHFKLTVGVFVIILVGIPSQLQHGITDFTNHRVLTHQCLLIITGLGLGIASIGKLSAVRGNQVIFAFDPGFHAVTFLHGTGELTL